MQRCILLLTLVTLPLLAQKGNQKAFRNELSRAVASGRLTGAERQQYDNALKTLDAQRSAKKSGGAIDRKASRNALRDLQSIAQSPNLAEADRAKLSSYLDDEKGKRKDGGKGKRKGEGKGDAKRKKQGNPPEPPKAI